jgi:hypothetical protein
VDMEWLHLYEDCERLRERVKSRLLRALMWFVFGAFVGAWLHSSVAAARDLTINDQQQQAIYVICEKGARSPINSLDEFVDIGLFCRSWRDLIARNNTAVPEQKPPVPPQTSEK